MAEETLIADADQLCEETQAWLEKMGFRTLGELTQQSASALEALPEFEDYYLWEVEDALEARGLKLLPGEESSSGLGVLTLDDWVRRLAETCPHARELTAEQVRAAMRERGYDAEDMKRWEEARPPSHFKHVLYLVAPMQPEWLYASDWKGSRDEAARAFERLLSLPQGHLSPDAGAPLSTVADDANGAAEELGTTDERLDYLAPYDDDCVFARTSTELRDALIAAFVLVPTSIADYEKRGEGPLTLTESTYLEEVDAFANDALNLFENELLRTVGELVAASASQLRRRTRVTGVVDHIEDVLARAGLHLRP